MRKQVTFAECRTVHRPQEEAFPRSFGITEPRTAATLNFNHNLKVLGLPAKRCEPQVLDVITIQIPKSMTAAPFLKHAALTPAQREYLYTVAASCSTAHVRNLIYQHYMNVLHRCIGAGPCTDRDDVSSSVNSPVSEGSCKQQNKVLSRAKQKEKMNKSARNTGTSPPPKSPGRKSRLSNTSASKQRKMEKRTSASAALRRKSPKREGAKLEEGEEKKEEEDDALSECFSSISLEEQDTFLFE